MSRLFETPEDMSEYLFRIVDNGGESADRYTVVFTDGSYLALSGAPTHPQGVSLSGESMDPQVLEDWVENGTAVDLALGDLPKHIVDHIVARNNQGFEHFLELIEAKNEKHVARDRDSAEANEGVHDSLGKGIYLDGEAFKVKLDADPEEDRGPFATAREAVLATIPDAYGFSGPEYHSLTEVMRMEPNEDIAGMVSALEERVEATASEGMRASL